MSARYASSIEAGCYRGLYFERIGVGDPILAIHGFGENRLSWRHLIAPLSQGRQLYLFDLLGHGNSDKPASGDYSLQYQADILFDFIAENDLRAVSLLGHSMGGGIALLVAIRLTEDSPDRLASLVLLDTIAFPQKMPVFMRLLRFGSISKFFLRMIPPVPAVNFILRRAYFDCSRITESAVAAYAQNLMSGAGVDSMVETASQIIPQNLDSIVAKYSIITARTLLVWGRNDKFVSPAVGVLLNTEIGGSTLSIIEGCGHIPHEELPSVVIPKIVSFLMPGSSSARR